MKSLEEVKLEYPLHWQIWNGNAEKLQQQLQTDQIDKEKIDPRGRTPLMMAVRLANLECVKCLLAAKCNATYEHAGWSIVQEAVCTGDVDILTAIIEVRDLQRHVQRVTHVPQLLQHLLDAPDFYIEMKWEFTSWVPLMSRLCPSDTYKVYKRGANVRIDTTLLGFDNNTWQRGNRSYIFKGARETATMIEIDHVTHEVMVEQMSSDIGDIVGIPPPLGTVRARLAAPVITNNIEMEKISFERNKSGIWGWRSEKSEMINGYNCKVYGASNVEFVTKTRMDHLSEEQIKNKTARTPLHSLLGIADEDYVNVPTDAAAISISLPRPGDAAPVAAPPPVCSSENGDRASPATAQEESNGSSVSGSGASTPHLVTVEEYFSPEVDLHGRDIGKPKNLSTKVQRFKANLWLAEDHPIRLQEQVLPILDLMSTMASPHVSKLKDFITMQLPAGFPVKVEIPLFHVLNACITFGNVFAMRLPVDHVTTLQEQDRVTCLVDDRCFDIPSHYVSRGGDSRRQMPLDEDDMLQYAIEQSLAETSGAGAGAGACGLDNDSDKVDIWEVLRGQQHAVGSELLPEDDEQLQRASGNSCSRSCWNKRTVLVPTQPYGRHFSLPFPVPNSSSHLATASAGAQFKNDFSYMKKIFK
ncbi:ankyrin repeat domain-containing protein 13D isoform X2 [Drosophila grimshawi]|uniref:ankyrin repeat domain-containing protein 13D isoform X2 n=1 Tax=Drosophila grimshawi TaxID=7222 RepID=UPI000C86E951|nr:ankyrin repeat domain-containing protein 13D isoform X2 [Drosophila grimshawi]